MQLIPWRGSALNSRRPVRANRGLCAIAFDRFVRYSKEEKGRRGSTLHEYERIGELLAERPGRADRRAGLSASLQARRADLQQRPLPALHPGVQASWSAPAELPRAAPHVRDAGDPQVQDPRSPADDGPPPHHHHRTLSALRARRRRRSEAHGVVGRPRRAERRRSAERPGERGPAAPGCLKPPVASFPEGPAVRLAPLSWPRKAPSWGEFGESRPFLAFPGQLRAARKVLFCRRFPLEATTGIEPV